MDTCILKSNTSFSNLTWLKDIPSKLSITRNIVAKKRSSKGGRPNRPNPKHLETVYEHGCPEDLRYVCGIKFGYRKKLIGWSNPEGFINQQTWNQLIPGRPWVTVLLWRPTSAVATTRSCILGVHMGPLSHDKKYLPSSPIPSHCFVHFCTLVG